MANQVLASIEAWHNRLQLVREVRAAIAEHEATIRAAKERMELEVAENRRRLAHLRDQEARLMAGVKEQAVANYLSSGQKTFAGVQIRKQERLKVIDLEAAIELLAGFRFDGKPLVRRSLDERATLGYVKAMASVGVPVGPVEIEVDYSVALIAESEATNDE